jgi:death on curing protein
MRFLTLDESLQLHKRIVEQSGGARGILDLGLLVSALG